MDITQNLYHELLQACLHPEQVQTRYIAALGYYRQLCKLYPPAVAYRVFLSVLDRAIYMSHLETLSEREIF